MKIVTLDITAKEWFDKINGNSYFSAQIIINYGLADQQEIKLPFQYGYGDHYIDMAKEELQRLGIMPEFKYQLWQYCEPLKIILRTRKIEKCLKREVVSFGA